MNNKLSVFMKRLKDRPIFHLIQTFTFRSEYPLNFKVIEQKVSQKVYISYSDFKVDIRDLLMIYKDEFKDDETKLKVVTYFCKLVEKEFAKLSPSQYEIAQFYLKKCLKKLKLVLRVMSQASYNSDIKISVDEKSIVQRSNNIKFIQDKLINNDDADLRKLINTSFRKEDPEFNINSNEMLILKKISNETLQNVVNIIKKYLDEETSSLEAKNAVSSSPDNIN